MVGCRIAAHKAEVYAVPKRVPVTHRQKHGVLVALRSLFSTFVVDSQNKTILHSLRILYFRDICD